MRKPVIASSKDFDKSVAEEKYKETLQNFYDYLESSPYKPWGTRHELMGPIPKILQWVFNGNTDVNHLSGYAYRVHEMRAQKDGAVIKVSEKARMLLESGIDAALELYSLLPPQLYQRTRDRIEHALYYMRRKNHSMNQENIKSEFAVLLQNKYSSIEGLRTAWDNDTIKDFKVYPSKNNDAYRKNSVRKNDIDEFWKQRKESGVGSIIIEEDE